LNTKEKRMAYPKNSKSALLALAATSGLWLWQNRDKVGSWLKQKQSDLQQATSNMSQTQQPSSTYTPPASSGSYTTPNDSFRTTTGGNQSSPGSYTGQTRKINEQDLNSL
jgi:hypothetical protein